MRVAIIAGLAAALLAGCGGRASGDMLNRPLAANPSAFVAAEIGFARLAREKGQWTAFRETSHPDAVMFVPQRVKARDWLKTQADPAEAVRWQPHAVYVSCDGNVGATTGAWQKGTETGYFTTIWVRDHKSGKMSWVLDHGDTLAKPRIAPEFIASQQATCGGNPPAAAAQAEHGADVADGMSPDRTMSWTSVVRADGSRTVTIRQWNGSIMQPLIEDRVAAPAKEPRP